MKQYNRLILLYDYSECWSGWFKYGNSVAWMRREMMPLLE